MRVLGLDLGQRRIGVAVSDPDGLLATPRQVLERTGSLRRDHDGIAGLVDEVGAASVVVGLPLSLDGSVGPAARAVLDEAEKLRRRLPVPVDLHDERLTTVEAGRALAGAGVGGRRRRKVIDEAAAAVMLQSWLDTRRATSHG